jgi:hypothetical protein
MFKSQIHEKRANGLRVQPQKGEKRKNINHERHEIPRKIQALQERIESRDGSRLTEFHVFHF